MNKLFDAVRKNDIEQVEMLLRCGYDSNSRRTNVQESTPLMWACIEGYIEIVELLLKYGCKVNEQDRSGATALMFACKYGHIGICNMLLGYGANPNVKSKGSSYAYRLALEGNFLAICELLLKYGADISNVEKEDTRIDFKIFKDNPYHILGLEAGSSKIEIKKAYLKLAKLHHPDHGGNIEEFQKIEYARSKLFGIL